jgi:uncharacterized protein YbbK (DUF523 family)
MKNRGKQSKIPIGISSCLLGEPVRYDGDHKLNLLITSQLQDIFEFRHFCPEVAIGLGVPRDPIQLVHTARGIRVRGVQNPALDVTSKLDGYGKRVATDYADICGYIFKARSPSCGTAGVATWTEQGLENGTNGTGVYAAALIEAIPGLPVTDEERLQDPLQRKLFIEEVTSWYRKQHHGHAK